MRCFLWWHWNGMTLAQQCRLFPAAVQVYRHRKKWSTPAKPNWATKQMCFECRGISLIGPPVNLISVRDRRPSLRNEAAGLRSKGVWVPFCLEPPATLTLPFPALLEHANISSMDNLLIFNAKASYLNTICNKHFSLTRIKENITSRSNQLSLFCYLSLACMKFLM